MWTLISDAASKLASGKHQRIISFTRSTSLNTLSCNSALLLRALDANEPIAIGWMNCCFLLALINDRLLITSSLFIFRIHQREGSALFFLRDQSGAEDLVSKRSLINHVQRNCPLPQPIIFRHSTDDDHDKAHYLRHHREKCLGGGGWNIKHTTGT